MYVQAYERIVDALPAACAAVYGARLKSLALFGSVARGTMRPDSDIDVLVVADPLPGDRDERMQEFAHVEAAVAGVIQQAQASGVHTYLSPVLKTPRELRAGSLLFLDMIDEARILVDADSMLGDFLADLSARLKAMGARRVRKGGGYYWELKPDYQWGERIEL